MTLFNSARIKLTLLYLLISILISSFFSILIYRVVSKELEQCLHQGAVLQRAHELGIKVPRHLPKRLQDIDPQLSTEEICPKCGKALSTAKQAFLIRLGVFNIFIWSFSAGAGYFLAGKALEPLKHSMKEQKRFVADASHELRTPLTAIKTSIEVALRDKNTSPQELRDVLSNNLKDLAELEKLTESLLKLSQYIEKGRDLEFEKVNLRNVVEPVVEKFKPVAKEKNIELNINVDKIIVKGSRESLEEMFSIFIDNALKYTNPEGVINITAKARKDTAQIKFSDTGIGISKEDLPHIFDRFYRTDSSRSKQDATGFGLGLSVAEKIIELHNGSVKVESTPKEGTTFVIRLPLSSSL
ncbi:MAG: sensor histidine kinase [Patescibacteria group bacterium]